jgi:ABC-type multidrug transport system ATPase subunit
MSEEILKALTQLFAIISKQDDGVTENERQFVIRFFQQELDQDSVREYVELYDQFSGYQARGTDDADKNKLTSVKDSVKTLGICRKINKTLAQKQKVIVLIKLLEMVGSEKNFSAQAMAIISTVSTVFNIQDEEYKLIESFVMAVLAAAIDFADVLAVNAEATASGRQKHGRAHLEGNLLFMRVRSVELYFAKYLGAESNVLNGFIMHPGRVYLFSPGSTIKTPAGDALYYSDVVSHFNEEIKTTRLSFNAHIEEFRFPNGATGLRDILITEGPGKLIGIMGASGAGKTTLLNVLAGLEKPSQGAIVINGRNIHTEKEKTHGVIGYVAQDDLLLEELTVYQNLYYNAKLCFDGYTHDQLHQRVMGVLEDLGLDQRRDLKVGNVLDKTISGGQRKRLNIALELIREPAVLFLDEPTSGLSSRDSENVVDLLKELSLKGKLVFVVIHQPSSDIYKMFDKMVILDTGGYLAYYGMPVEAIRYFKKATHQVDSNRGQCESCGSVNPEQIFNIMEARVVDEYGQATPKRKVTPPQWYDLYKDNFKIARLDDETEAPPKSLRIPSKLKQALIFATRDVLAKISNRQYLLINLLEAPVLAMVLSFIIKYNSAPDGRHYIFRFNDNFPAFLLMSIIVALFMGLTVSAEEIIRDRKLLRRESFLNLSWNSYILSKVSILFMLSAIQMFFFVFLGNWILEIHGMTFSFWFALFTVSCFANVLGLNISSAFNSSVTVYVLIPLLLIPQMILSGLLFPFDKLNPVLSEKGRVPVVADLMVSRWAYEAMAVYQFTKNDYEEPFFEYEKAQSGADFKSAYLIDELLKRNLFIATNIASQNDSLRKQVDDDLGIVRMALTTAFPKEPGIKNEFTRATYSTATDRRLQDYLAQAKKENQDRYNEFIAVAEKKMAFYEKNGWSVNENKNRHFNQALADLVRNVNTKERLLPQGGRLIQQIDPVFQDALPSHALDYRAGFFVATKHFLGARLSTYSFNLIVIWLMSLALYLMLFAEVFRKGLTAAAALFSRVSQISKRLQPKNTAFPKTMPGNTPASGS